MPTRHCGEGINPGRSSAGFQDGSTIASGTTRYSGSLLPV